MASSKTVQQKKFSDDPMVDLERRVARALNHPVRAKILTVLNRKCAGPSDLANMLDSDLPNIAYHFKVLHELRMIEPIDEVRIRGGTKTIYRGCSRMLLNDVDWAKLSGDAKSCLSIFSVGALFEKTKAAMKAGTFDSKADRHLSTTTLPVDSQGWSEISDLLGEVLGRVIEIEAQSAARADASGSDERFDATVNLMSFESPNGSPS